MRLKVGNPVLVGTLVFIIAWGIYQRLKAANEIGREPPKISGR